jgi:protein-S-isoprenylcysteine O-methyltransferase Ste14
MFGRKPFTEISVPRTDFDGAIEALLPVPSERLSMELDQETRREILVGTGSVALFVALLVWVGTMYSDNGLTETGALAVVGVIVVFVLVMTLVGYWMAQQY